MGATSPRSAQGKREGGWSLIGGGGVGLGRGVHSRGAWAAVGNRRNVGHSRALETSNIANGTFSSIRGTFQACSRNLNPLVSDLLVRLFRIRLLSIQDAEPYNKLEMRKAAHVHAQFCA